MVERRTLDQTQVSGASNGHFKNAVAVQATRAGRSRAKLEVAWTSGEMAATRTPNSTGTTCRPDEHGAVYRQCDLYARVVEVTVTSTANQITA